MIYEYEDLVSQHWIMPTFYKLNFEALCAVDKIKVSKSFFRYGLPSFVVGGNSINIKASNILFIQLERGCIGASVFAIVAPKLWEPFLVANIICHGFTWGVTLPFTPP